MLDQTTPPKTPRIIPRPRQRKAAKAVVKNLQLDSPLPMGKVLGNVGYSEGATLTPSRVVESAGFKQALYDLGLTEELITTSLVNDINDKPQKRIQELTLGAKILGMIEKVDPPPPPSLTTNYNFIFSPETRAAVQAMEDQLKAKLIENAT